MPSIAQSHAVHGRPWKFVTFIAHADEMGEAKITTESPPIPTRSNLAPVANVKKANEVFTPEQLLQRLDAYAARAVLDLPLFHDGPPDVPVLVYPRRQRNGVLKPVAQTLQCFACDDAVVAQSARREGWKVRSLAGDANESEAYCPTCFDRYGWGDEDNGE